MDSRFSAKLEKWDGDTKLFNKILPPLINQHFKLYYREEFRINPTIDRDRIIKEEELSKFSIRLLNVIISMTRSREDFYLEDAIETVHDKNRDKLIEALEVLIEKQILVPSRLEGI